jgi:hypothetical protein
MSEPAIAPSAEARLEALAAGLRRWADRQAAAEERLAGFAFREEGELPAVEPARSWEALIVRALDAAADPAVIRLLRIARGAGVPIGRLVGSGEFGTLVGDRVAVTAWLGALASAGLVSRELEADAVSTTALGEALVGLVDDLVGRLVRGGAS